jgi:putative PIN family toxin of toxin-antitoxin system
MPVSKLDRIILDTNILVSLIINQDADMLADWVAEYSIGLYICPELIDELKSTFEKPAVRKFLSQPTAFYIDFIMSVCEVVPISRRCDRAYDPRMIISSLIWLIPLRHIISSRVNVAY